MHPEHSSESVLEALRVRRAALGVGLAALAERSGVAAATTERILSRRPYKASLSDVAALAAAMGLRLELTQAVDDVAWVDAAAEAKARRLVDLVQGTSLLEEQGVANAQRDQMVRETKAQLLKGSRRKLWGGP